MVAAYHNQVRNEVFNLLPGLFAQISLKEEGGLNYLVIFVRYLGETQLPEDVDKLIEQTKQLSTEVGGEMLTAAETWTLQEKIEMVERFLKAGVPWEMVVKATGITQEKLEELKATLQELMPRQTQLERSQSPS